MKQDVKDTDYERQPRRQGRKAPKQFEIEYRYTGESAFWGHFEGYLVWQRFQRYETARARDDAMKLLSRGTKWRDFEFRLPVSPATNAEEGNVAT